MFQLETLSSIKKFGLVLDAPLVVTGSEKNFYTLSQGSEQSSRNMLNSWWDIYTKEDLESTLRWLDVEGGHTREYHRVLDELYSLTHRQQIQRVEQAAKEGGKQPVRFRIAKQYLYDLGPATIYAFDVVRSVMLTKAGYCLGWLDEAEAWERVEKKAHEIISKQTFPTHEDYLLSFAVGRTFAMGNDAGNIKQTNQQVKWLMLSAESPYQCFIDWAEIVNANVAEGVS